jgi:acetyltransferase-like isoleucine patch superfamily enzyme
MSLKLGKDVKIHPTATINVEHGFIGDRSIIRANAVIDGREVRIGNESIIEEYAHIGGGSCFDPTSILEVGDFFHLGKFAMLNQGRGVRIGHEVACGLGTRVFTHGAYLSAWDGFPAQWGPVSIGNRVFLSNAIVNPNVSIGDNVCVASGSVVTRDLPSGCMAGGVPCRIIKENIYPRKLSYDEKQLLFDRIFSESVQIYKSKYKQHKIKISYEQIDEDVFSIAETTFDLAKRTIDGAANEISEVLKNQLRRNGIRFRYYVKDGAYVKW